MPLAIVMLHGKGINFAGALNINTVESWWPELREKKKTSEDFELNVLFRMVIISILDAPIEGLNVAVFLY